MRRTKIVTSVIIAVIMGFYIFNLHASMEAKDKYADSLVLEKDSLTVTIDSLQQENEKIVSYLEYLFNKKAILVTVTGYHPVQEQCDSTPDITADGTKINIDIASDYRYVAVSRDLLTRWGGKIRYGDYILIKGTKNARADGIYQVRDTMHPKHTNWVDVLLTPGEKAFYEQNILMYKIKDDYSLLINYNLFPNLDPVGQFAPELQNF